MHCVFSPKTKTKDVPYPSKKKKRKKKKKTESKKRHITSVSCSCPAHCKDYWARGSRRSFEFRRGKVVRTGRLVFSKTNYMGKLFFTFVLKKIYEIFFCHLSRLLISEFGV